MKVLVIVAFIFLAGCAQHSAFRVNDTRWSESNRKKREACILVIVEVAPPTATREELDFNFERCLLANDVFI